MKKKTNKKLFNKIIKVFEEGKRKEIKIIIDGRVYKTNIYIESIYQERKNIITVDGSETIKDFENFSVTLEFTQFL
jgi:cytochrome b involved in lipid metabolism